MFEKFLNNNFVKFIFFDERHLLISSDKDIHEIHRFKSKYPGNRYVRLPLHVNEVDGRMVIEVVSGDDCVIDGYAVVSKSSLVEAYPCLRNASSGDRKLFGDNMCKQKVMEFNNLLMVSYGV